MKQYSAKRKIITTLAVVLVAALLTFFCSCAAGPATPDRSGGAESCGPLGTACALCTGCAASCALCAMCAAEAASGGQY